MQSLAFPARAMAGSVDTSTSSMTSTSHTLTHAPGPNKDSLAPPPNDMAAALLQALEAGKRHEFLQPNPSVPNASLRLVKSTLDSYAGQLSDEQQQRLREASKKRKRADRGPSKAEVLKVRKLHVDGFESSQVWEQARRIISSALQESQDALAELEANHEIRTEGSDGHLGSDSEENPEVDSDVDAEDDGEDGLSGEDVSGSEDENDEDEDGLMSGEEDLEGLEGIEDGDDQGDEDEEETAARSEDEEDEEDETSGTLVEDPNGLNDGFFSIDDFNKQTQWFENQDAKADPNTDAASDDDEIDWHADPYSEVPGAKRKKSDDDDDEEDLPSDMEADDEERGPAFEDMKMDAPEGESGDEDMDDMEDLEDGMGEMNANDVFYKDFFAPPARKGTKNGKPRKPKQPRTKEPDDTDIERAMADVRRDLFEDESEHGDSDDGLSDVSAGDPRSRRSAHERRQAKLAEEIRKLESANVAEKKWALAGEASAADRPKHSLLDEEFDYEHAGKPVPVITAEISESIEQMIKRRILAQEFDEVIRRRPDTFDQSGSGRRGLVELDDTKNKQSLAEMYEEEHVKNANPDSYVSKADEKVQKEEKEIEQMWRDLCGKLDSLSSWHYKPKPAAPSLSVVADVATVSMEDAQPATAQGVSGGDHALAPQEIYKAGKNTAEKGEIVAKSGLPVAKQELSREEKARRRRREKERIRKAGGNDRKPLGGRAQAQKDAVADLKKGGVKVINKKGELLDMEGNKARDAMAKTSGSFKL